MVTIACDRPIAAVPTVAVATKGMAICWRHADQADAPFNRRLRDALEKRLLTAGYALVPASCDLQLTWTYQTRERYGDEAVRGANVTIRNSRDEPVDTIQMTFGQADVPSNDLDRLAILMVNEINASRKAAAVGSKRPATPTALVPARAIALTPQGVVVHYDVDGNAALNVVSIQNELAHVQADARIDVTIDRHAKWITVKTALDALLAVHPRVRLHVLDDVLIDADLKAPATWGQSGTWVTVALQTHTVVVTWQTDRSCADVPRSVPLLASAHMDDLRQRFTQCQSTTCFDRLQIDGAPPDSAEYLEILTAAVAPLHGAPLALAVHNPLPRPDPTCRVTGAIPTEELDLAFSNRFAALAACARDYQGKASVMGVVDSEGRVKSLSVALKDIISDFEKTCIASLIGAMTLPAAARDTPFVYPLIYTRGKDARRDGS